MLPCAASNTSLFGFKLALYAALYTGPAVDQGVAPASPVYGQLVVSR